MDWSKYPNFSEAEFRCKHTGVCYMDTGFMIRLQRLRTEWRRPMSITSGYRSPSHPAERNKTTTGAHVLGRAADVRMTGNLAPDFVALAIKHGFTGIGIKLHGSGTRFIHLDDVPPELLPRPMMWSYSGN